MAEQAFAELQARFRQIWPSVALRSTGDVERTLVVVHSISFEVPDQFIPVFPAPLVDGRDEPLTRKLIARPGALRRIRGLIGDPEVALLLPFCMTGDEVALAEALQLTDGVYDALAGEWRSRLGDVKHYAATRTTPTSRSESHPRRRSATTSSRSSGVSLR